MQSGGGNPMNAAQLARLQQQLAQYGRGSGQQQMMNPAMGGMGNQQSHQQQLQQAFMQQQLQQNQGNQGGMQARRNSSLGMNSNSAAALAMMQQQQQQVAAGGSQMANANMSSYWNALQNQNSGTMDASSASSAQLAALTGMNMNGNNQQQNNAANMLLGNRSSQQPQQQQQQQVQMQGLGSGNQQAQGMGQTNDANLLQQQIAQLQRQLQQQQQQQGQPQNQGMGMQGNASMDRRNSGGSFGMQGNQQQQQLFQQMQQQMANGMTGQDAQQAMGMQQNKMGNDFPMNAAMQNQNAMQQNLRNSVSSNQGAMGNQSRGTLNEQDLLLQQQQLLRSSGMSNSMQSDTQKVQDMFGNQQNSHADLMGQRRTSMQQADPTVMGNRNSQVGMGNRNSMGFDMDGSVSSQRSANRNKNNANPLDLGGLSGDKVDDGQKSFLDGSFAGGWQSNADLPDRRRIIFSILEVIRQMRPDTNKISQKLPHMAKSLEEHLYRSAQTKEEYLDPSTLKKRLQLIAHGLEIHRSTSSGSVNSHSSQNKNQSNANQGNMGGDNQQLQQLLAMQQGNNMNQNQNQMGMNNNLSGMVGGNNGMQNNMSMDMMQGIGGMDTSINSMSQNASMMQGDGSNHQDRVAAQKKKVIRQQQQRLLLLRHASKCKEGPNCTTKFCAQMMTLWKHMKKCRDKNCRTSHCLSSRCVLNHYRICKSQGRTATCEVCGPVMEQIKRQDQEGAMDSSDPLAAKPDPDLGNQSMPPLQQQMSSFGQMGNNSQNNVQAMQQQAMQQLYQQQQQALQQNQQGPLHSMQSQSQNSQNMQGLGGMQGNRMQNDNLQTSQSGGSQDSQQMQQMQNAQQKIQQQQQVLRQLQKQQAQLLEQQKQLQEQQAMLKDPGTQQAQQLQQQHALLQQLQRRCQQQQALIQQELMLQKKTLEQGGQGMMDMNQQMNQQMNAQLGNGSQNSQQMGNNSQNSQHSSHSQQNSNVLSGNIDSLDQNQLQSNPLQSQIPGLDQGGLDALGDDKSGDPLSTGQDPLQSQLQNQLPSQTSNDGSDLLQVQDLGSQDDVNPIGQDLDSAPAPVDQAEGSNDNAKTSDADGLSEVPKTNEETLSDGSERSSNSKRRNSKPVTTPSRPIGARGRVGKGKRLKDIADDLGGAGASIIATDTSILSRKRTADHMDGDDKDAQANKSQRGDSDKDTRDDEGDNTNGDGDQNSSLTSSMPKGDVEQHLLLLHKGLHLTSRTITHKCLPIVQQLIDDPFGWVFRDAVDPVVFGLPDYFEVVKNPMHLLLVKKKLENAVYTDMASFERDVKLVFENAILYNGEESEVGQLAQTMMGVFEREYKKVCEVSRNELAPVDPNACKLCGLGSRPLQPPILFCVDMACGMQKIQRNAKYYTKGSILNVWCEKCYSKLKDNETIMLEDGSETKKCNLHMARNDSSPEETWMKCTNCNDKVHQICALTSDRICKAAGKFMCPKCDLKNREGMDLKPKPYSQNSSDLQKCTMSDSIEEGLFKNLASAYEAKSKELGVSPEEIEKPKGLSIRVLSHTKKKHVVRDEMYNVYSSAGFPSDFPVHTKCVGLFQSLDGVDVLLFAMYVYEYGHDCPAQNRRRVYISYLDSVQYFEPRMFRTVAYQSVITEYLRFVKKRGFHTAHIWSCPPTPGDEYVFYCHPPAQKIPQEEKLRDWYLDLLAKAKDDGIVVEMTNFYEEYFQNNGVNSPSGNAATPMSLPYFEGDYIPGEIENILSLLTKEEKRQLQFSFSSAPRRSGSKLGTRSNPGQLVSQTQDKIMEKLGKAINNMQENFMIVRLRSKEFAAAVERGDDVSEWPDDEDRVPVLKGKGSSVILPLNREEVKVEKDETQPNSAEFGPVTKKESPEKSRLSDMEAVLSRRFAQGAKVGDTVDSDPQFETELFENRQLFLNYCQRNYYQFDDLRKAKHATMMLLFQLHNSEAPKFFEICHSCHRDIAFGNRFHCNICQDYDLCDECYKPVTNGMWAYRGKRYTHDSSHTFSRISTSDAAEAKKSQQERAKSLQGYLEVLNHAANCPGNCQLKNCEKMKKLILHVKTCKITYQNGCKVCHRLLSLIIVHARSCAVRGKCPLPFCDKIRERHERARRQQQYMDDRRRQAQNSYYASSH